MANKMLKFLQSTVEMFELLNIADCSISKTTASLIIKNCISVTIKEELFQSLCTSPYSLLLDESTDAYGASFLAICTKYLSEANTRHPVTKLITIIQLGETQTDEALFQIVHEEVLSKFPQLQKNLISIVTDQGANMVGRSNGLEARLQTQYPYILPLHDLSHIYNLICKSSIRVFPSNILEMASQALKH